jgi:hypothetical protein
MNDNQLPIKKTSNIDDYCLEELTDRQLAIARKLMEEHGYKGQPFFTDAERFYRNLLAVNLIIDGIEITVKSHSGGFDFHFYEE